MGTAAAVLVRHSIQPIREERPRFGRTSRAMIPLLPQELLTTAVEMVCYFCTAVGVVLTLWLAPRG